MTESRATTSKHTAAAHLSPPARRVHRAILTEFAQSGRAPTPADPADERGIDVAGILAELTAADLIVLDAEGNLRAAYPFSAIPTPHRVTIADGPTVHAMCAIDALGISAMLGRPVTITSDEPGTAQTVHVHVDGDQADWTPSTAVVVAATTSDCCAPSAQRTCPHINFFTTPAAAHLWTEQHGDTTAITLHQHDALAHGITEFGTLLREDE